MREYAVAGDRTRVTRVTGGNTYHYTTTTLMADGLTTLVRWDNSEPIGGWS